MRIRRRDFLKASATAGALAALRLTPFNALAAFAGPPPLGTAPGEWIATSCQGCTTWCPVQVLVQDGRAVKVRGNEFSRQNDGTCCPRGHLSLQLLYDPDRVKVPMRRTNPEKGRGVDPKWVPITWDEALETIADRILALRKAGTPERYLLMRGRYTYMRDVIYDAMTKIIGSPNNISHSAICSEAEKFASYYTEGLWDYRDYDIGNSEYALIWGSDPVSSNRMVPAAIRRFGDLLDRATVAVVDPRMSTSAAKAHEWLPIRPGEDGALAGAIAHVLLVEGLWNREFVGDFADGRNLFRAGATVAEGTFREAETHGLVRWWNIELKDRTPRWAAGKTGLSEEQIVRVARGLGKAAPKAVVWLGPGACMHVRGAYTGMAIHALNGLLGSVDRTGGSLGEMSPPVHKMPDVKPYQDELAAKHAALPKIDKRGSRPFPALAEGKSGGGVVTNHAAEGILSGDPNEIEVAIGYMNNFAFSCTGADRWERALAKIPFFAHITTHASETTWFADIVLPSAMSTYEKWGYLKGKQNRYGYASLLQPVVAPMWDVRIDETEIPYLLAERLAAKGFDNLLRYFRTEWKDPETGTPAGSAEEFAWVAVKHYTAPLWDGTDTGGDHLEGWSDFRRRGLWNSAPYPDRKRWGKFATATAKFEFFSETLRKSLEDHARKHSTTVDDVMADANYTARGETAFVPHYEPPVRHGDAADYPFVFVDYKSRLNREGRSQNAPWYMEFKKVDPGDQSWADVLKMNPDDARRLGIAEGDLVRVTSVTGSFTIRAHPWPGIGPGVVTKAYGQGHWAYGRVAAGKSPSRKASGANNNALLPADYERLSGSTARNGGFTGVRIEKAG